MAGEGFARGIFGPSAPGSVASLRHDLSSFARTLDLLASEQLTQVMETALRKSLSEICLGTAQDLGTEYEVRTAVRDHNTCQTCRNLHGQVFRIGSPEHREYAPPHHCESERNGKSKCRCVYDAVPPGQTGLRLIGQVTEVSLAAVRGEVLVERYGRAQLSSPELRALEAARPDLVDELLNSFHGAEDQLDEIEARRIIEDALTRGKPVLTHNVLAYLEQFVASGALPTIAERVLVPV